MIKSVLNLLVALQSNSSPGEIAAGVVLALFVGFTPLSGTHVIFFALAFFFLKMQKGATVIAAPIFKLVYVLGFSKFLDTLGYTLLVDVEALRPFWAWVVHAPVLAYLNLNQTLVLGGCAAALVLSLPVYFATETGVKAYRSYFHSHIEKWAVVKWLTGLSMIKWVASWWPSDR